VNSAGEQCGVGEQCRLGDGSFNFMEGVKNSGRKLNQLTGIVWGKLKEIETQELTAVREETLPQ
jgi:hypothetical protein